MSRPTLPTIGNPNTSRELRNDTGDIIQRRFWGGDGRAIKNIDFDHDHGAGQPHAHDWDWTQDPPRQPGEEVEQENANMVFYKDDVASRLDSSIHAFLERTPHKADSMRYALITSLDSNLSPGSLLGQSPELNALAEQAQILGMRSCYLQKPSEFPIPAVASFLGSMKYGSFRVRKLRRNPRPQGWDAFYGKVDDGQIVKCESNK